MYSAAAMPHFAKVNQDTVQFNHLRKLVYKVVEQLPESRRRYAQMKAVLLPLIYLFLYASALLTDQYAAFCLLYVCMGLMLVILFLNLIHEACHENLFSRKKLNRYYMLLFDLVGANSYMWKQRHVRMHHNYPNVVGWDTDIEKSNFIKVHPQHHKKFFFRLQHLLVVLYPLFVINWFLVRDFKDFFSNKMIVRKLGDPPLMEYGKLFFFKLFFIGYVFVLPVMVTPFRWSQVLFAFFLLLFGAGLFALMVLIPPHANTGNQFPDVDEHLALKQSWFLHQLVTTNDVNGCNWFTRNVLGNFNFHIAHHLFPNLSYVYAKEVTDVIRSFCKEEGLPYRSFPLLATFLNHYRLIRKNGQVMNIWEEDM